MPTGEVFKVIRDTLALALVGNTSAYILQAHHRESQDLPTAAGNFYEGSLQGG